MNPDEIINFVDAKMDKAKLIKDVITKKINADYDDVSEPDLNEILKIAYRKFENYKGVNVNDTNKSTNYYVNFTDWALQQPDCKSILTKYEMFCDAPSTLKDLSKLTKPTATAKGDANNRQAQRKDFVSNVGATKNPRIGLK